MAWSYFHKLYEPDSTLARSFLLIAPNIIVLDRLRTDFDGLRISATRSYPATASKAATGATTSRSRSTSRTRSGRTLRRAASS